MLSNQEKLIRQMMLVGIEEARAALALKEAAHANGISAMKDRIAVAGFAPVDASYGVAILDDGREVMWLGSEPWALKPEIHAERVRIALEAERNRTAESETKSVVGTESLSAMVCPKCGDALQHTAVCPKCAAGKLGYRHRYTCVCGGVDLISKEVL